MQCCLQAYETHRCVSLPDAQSMRSDASTRLLLEYLYRMISKKTVFQLGKKTEYDSALRLVLKMRSVRIAVNVSPSTVYRRWKS